MDYLHNVLPPPQLFRLSTSALNELLLRWRLPTSQQVRANDDFDIASDSGFLPSEPLTRLPSAFEFWERALEDATETLSLGEDLSEDAIAKQPGSELWRKRIRNGPHVPVHTILRDKRILQRAHLVLAFLTHFYVHSLPPSDASRIVVPRTISVPLVTVSKALDIAPILTYADTVLWNMQPINPMLPISIDNMTFAQTFSGTDDEMEFYRASAGIELRGVELLHIVEDFHRLPNVTDEAAVCKIARDLNRVTSIIDDFGDIAKAVLAGCDRNIFYNNVRPWFCGSDATGPTAQRWIFEGVDSSETKFISGPSGGQSTIMHTLDVLLDIDHKLAQRRQPAPSNDNKKADQGFMQRMRWYMPGLHREYLEYLESSPRQLRELAKHNPILREPYNAAIKALKKFRDSHIRIVCLYVVNASRAQCPMMAATARRAQSSTQREALRGTGGTELTTLLKAGRDATNRAKID